MSWDVFEEAQGWIDFSYHPKDIWPEVSRVFIAELFARNAKGLTWISCSDAIHEATPRLAIEGS
jgi:hypothetical protein